MDISPKPPSSPDHKSGHSLTTEASIISNIKDLKLETDKLYKAKVLQELATNTTPLSEKTDTYTKPNTNNQAVKEWLLNINGKIVKTSGNLPIKSGDTLFVKLETSTSLQTNSLTIVRHAEQSISTNQNHQAIDSSILLNALSKLLPKQLSISSGFATLNKINDLISTSDTFNNLIRPSEGQSRNTTSVTQAATTSTPQQNEMRLIKGVIERLFQSLPQAEHITQKNAPEGAQTKPLAMQQVIEKSGSFLESSLINKEARKQLSSQLQNIRALENHLISSTEQTPGSQAKLNQISQSAKELTSSTLSKETFNLLQQLTKHNLISTPADKMTDKASPADLKATLLGLSQTIASPEPRNPQQTKPTQNLDKLLSQILEPELLNAPFNFPRIQSETTAKAQAILADQELTTGQLLKIIAGMLNRIQFNQLNSLYQSQNADSNTLQSWFLELPIVNTNQEITSFDIRIDKEKNPGSTKENESEDKALQWKLTLSFDLEELGAMYIQVSLLPPSISSIIWADTESTYRLAQSEAKHFKSKLTNLGLEVGEIICQKGLPPQQTTKLSQSLVDVQA